MNIKSFITLILIALSILPALFAEHKVVKVSGDNQWGMRGYPLKNDFVVKVLTLKNEPLADTLVSFVIVKQPESNSVNKLESTLSSQAVISDKDGYAGTRLNLGYPQTGEIIVSATTNDSIGNPAVFNATSHSKYWILLMILGSIGGLGVFLFGMAYLNLSLNKIAGQKLREILITLTKSPVKGVFTGFFVTMLNQASSATTVLEITLVNAGLLTFYQAMSITMGAEIGSTITAQLVAFRVSDYAILIAGLGFFISVLTDDKKWKSIGESIIGIGFLFIGIKIMSDLFSPLKTYEPFVDFMKNLDNPFYAILTGLGITLIVRSSGVTSGIIIAFALAKVLTLSQAVPVILGAQMGTCFTGIIASVGRSTEAKRVALWHTIHQVLGVVFIVPLLFVFTFGGEPLWLYFIKWFTLKFTGTNDVARQIAMSHTLTAILNTAICFPLLPALYKLCNLILPSKEKEKPFGPVYIDDEFLSTPSLALEQARKEIVREGEIVLTMMKESLNIFQTQELKLTESVALKEIHADMLRNAIVPYLTKLGQRDLTQEQSEQETRLLFIADDLESIGDIVDKNIIPLIRKKLSNNLWFSDEGWKDIFDFYTLVTKNMEQSVAALKNNDLDIAKLIIEEKNDTNIYQFELRKRHIARLHSGVQESLETSGVHLDLIDQLKSINSHVTSICFTLASDI
ncbi:MAG: Na/Pi cotransporter family protein [Elusimicrobia bacterium]|nr:Na/Pi cotransporter family protein [Candidatus Liberimonas magnetica]